MTTGYDCTDILNICLMRPIFSPTDFVQIKGRGTRRHKFDDQIIEPEIKSEFGNIEKDKFKLFDFFGNYEYFEEKFNYDEILELPQRKGPLQPPPPSPPPPLKEYETFDEDRLLYYKPIEVGQKGMKVDRMLFDRFQETVKSDEFIRENIKAENWDKVLDYLNREIMNRPEDFFTPDKLRKSLKQDRRVTLREMLEYIFGLIPFIKSKDELLEDEFYKFISDYKPGDTDDIITLKYFFKTYIVNDTIRKIINEKRFADLAVNPVFPLEAYKSVPVKWRTIIPEYIQDYVPLNKFIS